MVRQETLTPVETESTILETNRSKSDPKISTAEFLKNETVVLPQNQTFKNTYLSKNNFSEFNSSDIAENNLSFEKNIFDGIQNSENTDTFLKSMNDDVAEVNGGRNGNCVDFGNEKKNLINLKKEDLEQLPPDKELLQNDPQFQNPENIESVLRNRRSKSVTINDEIGQISHTKISNNEYLITDNTSNTDLGQKVDEYAKNCTEILENIDTKNSVKNKDIQKFKKNREFAKNCLANSKSIDEDQNYVLNNTKIIEKNDQINIDSYDDFGEHINVDQSIDDCDTNLRSNTSLNTLKSENIIKNIKEPSRSDENAEGVMRCVDNSDFTQNFEENTGKTGAIDDAKEGIVGNKEENSNSVEFKPQLRWPDTIVQLFLHIGCVYGFFLLLMQAKLYTVLWAIGTVVVSGFGITAGAHRLWSHRSYKATWSLRAILIFLFTITGQRDAYTWALDHRVHHKYSESDSDPHNAKRGFFFAHVGWLVLTPHPDVVMRRKQVDMSDLEADSIVMWQKKYYIPLFALLAIGLPVMGPWYFWDENLWVSFWVNFNFRFCVTLNIAFFVNSVAHMWGQKPYDRNISPVENIGVAIAALGEGWHNYHHVFPYDYKTGELGGYTFNPTTGFIDFFARFGWAYDRKSVSQRMILRRALRSGDGSYLLDPHAEQTQIWGYGDTDIDPEDHNDLLNNGKLVNDQNKDD